MRYVNLVNPIGTIDFVKDNTKIAAECCTKNIGY